MATDDEPTDQAPTSVLDASALLALLQDEEGASVVVEAIAGTVAISVVNLAEVLTKLTQAGKDPEQAREQIRGAEAETGVLVIEPLVEADCVEIARLRLLTRALGLSLADRACLALAKRLQLPVHTADHSWTEVDLDVEIKLIR